MSFPSSAQTPSVSISVWSSSLLQLLPAWEITFFLKSLQHLLCLSPNSSGDCDLEDETHQRPLAMSKQSPSQKSPGRASDVTSRRDPILPLELHLHTSNPALMAVSQSLVPFPPHLLELARDPTGKDLHLMRCSHLTSQLQILGSPYCLHLAWV